MYSHPYESGGIPIPTGWVICLKKWKGNQVLKKNLMQINIQNNESSVLISTCLVKFYVLRQLFNRDDRKEVNQAIPPRNSLLLLEKYW